MESVAWGKLRLLLLVSFSTRKTNGGDVTFVKRAASGRVKQLLEGEHTCVVVITCGEPSEEGQMPVEMLYEGDSGLACFLLENAQDILRQELETNES